MKFDLVKTLVNPDDISMIPELCFSQDGSLLAASYSTINQLKVFDTASGQLVCRLENPAAEFDGPHGVLFIGDHLVVSNSHNQLRPSLIHVYRARPIESTPCFSLQSPWPELRECHSLAGYGSTVIATYCESPGRTGALATFSYDKQTGQLTPTGQLVEDVFAKFGDPKGVSVNVAQRLVYVTVQSELRLTPRMKGRKLFKYIQSSLRRRQPADIFHLLRSRVPTSTTYREPRPIRHNGVLVFRIENNGYIAPEPLQVWLRDTPCRLENVAHKDGKLYVSDTLNHRVEVFPSEDGFMPEQAAAVIDKDLWLPHGLKVSPATTQVAVTNFSLATDHNSILWGQWLGERHDHIQIFECH